MISAHRALALPVLDDAAGADAADAGDVEQAVGLAVDDVEDARCRRRPTSCLARCGPTPLISPDPRYRSMPSGESGGDTRIQSALNCWPVRAVLHPRAGGVDVFADGHLRGMPDDRRRLAPRAQGHTQDAEPALGVVVRDPLHRAQTRTPRLARCQPAVTVRSETRAAGLTGRASRLWARGVRVQGSTVPPLRAARSKRGEGVDVVETVLERDQRRASGARGVADVIDLALIQRRPLHRDRCRPRWPSSPRWSRWAPA